MWFLFLCSTSWLNSEIYQHFVYLSFRWFSVTSTVMQNQTLSCLVSLMVEHLPGLRNQVADYLSLRWLRRFGAGSGKWDMDLFASAQTPHSPGCGSCSLWGFFITSLMKAKWSTLKVYVAAIATQHVSINGPSLAHNLICQFLKGARRLCPSRFSQSPPWDSRLVFMALCLPPYNPWLGLSLDGSHWRLHFSWPLQHLREWVKSMLSKWAQCASDGAQAGLVSPCGLTQHFCPKFCHPSWSTSLSHWWLPEWGGWAEEPPLPCPFPSLQYGRNVCGEADRSALYLLWCSPGYHFGLWRLSLGLTHMLTDPLQAWGSVTLPDTLLVEC